jgi:hypothetical protein
VSNVVSASSISPFVRIFDSAFRAAGFLCPSKWLFLLIGGYRATEVQLIAAFDKYLTTWLLVEILCLVFVRWISDQALLAVMLVSVAGARIIDIVHVSMSVLLYGRFRDGDRYVVASLRRSLLINSINFLELLILFAFIYYGSLRADFRPELSSFLDSIYYSAVTQLTLGYGDCVPVSSHARLLAIGQAVCGYFFTILIFGRVVALLPKPVILSEPVEDRAIIRDLGQPLESTACSGEMNEGTSVSTGDEGQ